MSDLTVSLLRNLNYNFIVDENATTNDFAVFRSKFYTSEEVHSFVEEIQKLTNTNFRLSYTKSSVKRILFRKKWVCQHSSFRKRPHSKMNAGCGSFINVLIKKVNRFTQRNDHFLKLTEPLPCVIQINLNHTHSTEDVDALKKLSVTPEIKKMFEEYFENGLSVCEARKFHASQLIAHCDQSILANSAFNPRQHQVYYLYNKWRTENFGLPCHQLNKLKVKMSSYVNEGEQLDLVEAEQTDWISSIKMDSGDENSKVYLCETPAKIIKAIDYLNEEDEIDSQENQPLINEGVNISCIETDSSQDILKAVMDCSFLSSECSSAESISKTFCKFDEENIDVNLISNEKLFPMEENFTFKNLLKNLSLIKKPNSFWGISDCPSSKVIICARWTEDYVCRKRVVIDSSLVVKVFLNEWEINLSELMNIACIEDLSNLLEKVESCIKYHEIIGESFITSPN